MNLTTLYLARCRRTLGGNIVPHFWQPSPIKRENFSVFGDDREPVDSSWGVAQTVERILTLNLHLELPVGEYVMGALSRELPEGKYVLPLLRSNIVDEARHYMGFKYAVEAYPVSAQIIEQANALKNLWDDCAQVNHPLFAPMTLEVGLFLLVLGFLRVLGGRSLATLAGKVSEDEYRHVITNRTILTELKESAFNPPPETKNLLNDTLDWIFTDLKVPASVLGVAWDVDYFHRVSTKLLSTGECQDFDDLVYMADYAPPFELSNEALYDRSLDQ